ncbi:MAG: ABC-2 transporter permease [Erysipelotrichaceae bacterium]|nr:ABC-2 transporter permease [Erysipelotrichaceae bacterium]
MKALFKKELFLSASVLSYLFIAAGFMALIPGYPILCSVFFVTLGIFHGFQYAREANDIVYSALLPVAKRDVVKGRFLFVIFIEACAFLLMTAMTLLRMTLLAGVPVYLENALMNANPFFLGTALLLFGLFNLVFVGGFFKTAYNLGKPFVTYIIVCFLLIGIAEALHHFPGLEALNAFGFDHPVLQLSLLSAGLLLCILLTLLSYNKACKDFERTDL